jgi:hypothetical protein
MGNHIASITPVRNCPPSKERVPLRVKRCLGMLGWKTSLILLHLPNCELKMIKPLQIH